MIHDKVKLSMRNLDVYLRPYANIKNNTEYLKNYRE